MRLINCLGSITACILLVGCTGKDTIPEKPPKMKNKAAPVERSYSQMNEKLDRIRNPIKGISVLQQKQGLSKEVDSMLNETSNYKKEVNSFAKKQIKKRKRVKQYSNHTDKIQKDIKENNGIVNDENQLKYY